MIDSKCCLSQSNYRLTCGKIGCKINNKYGAQIVYFGLFVYFNLKSNRVINKVILHKI